ncbi:hypothetical protein GGX14DRAFT_486611 [Mycena pura]|uniref:RRM domain-containing protein n=1 Tax=Mycena pura TaxID=153505 RepID=A0AAD7E4C4_9AGAR|nr:hypothetical protein GGX14DRAFT_486611 [Mycena pura]
MSSASSSSSSSRAASPAPPKKRKRTTQDESDSDSESDASDDDIGASDHVDTDDGSDDLPVPDVPALSHAEKRRQKRREKAEKLQVKAAKKRKLPDGSAALVSTKRLNSVWVGNLNFKTTPAALTEFFKDAGEITRINMPTKHAKTASAPGAKPENQGFAYVDFATVDAKTVAIAMSEQNLLGRRLLIKDGDNFEGRPAVPGTDAAGSSKVTLTKSAQKILRVQKQPPAPTLFLGNLPFETTEEVIRELFDAHRPSVKKAGKVKSEDDEDQDPDQDQNKVKDAWIRKVRMGTFEDTGLCKGFAFVDFVSTEAATSALVNPKNHHLNGRALKVEYASADAVRRGAPKAQRDGQPLQRYKEAKRHGPRAEKKLKREMQQKSNEGDGPQDSAPPPTTAQPDVDPGKWQGRKERERPTSGKGPKNRSKPGAALALAKRESAAIVPSQGKKVVF